MDAYGRKYPWVKWVTPSPNVLTLKLPNSLEGIQPATVEAEAWLEAQQVAPDAALLVTLAIEELVTNCIKYGYDDAEPHVIEIVLSLADGQLTMLVIDDGHAFNPLTAPPPDLTQALEDRPIGGLGLHLLRELADEIRYERSGGTNRLLLTKQSPPAAS